MGLALNLIALLMVIGLSWTAMLWMSGRFHGERRDFSAEPFGGERPSTDSSVDVTLDRSSDTGDCSTCNGSGARKSQGRLTPCPVCEGTGILS